MPVVALSALSGPSDPALAGTALTLWAALPRGGPVGGAAVENLDLRHLPTGKICWSEA